MTLHRFVLHERVPDYLLIGWLALPSLEGTHHGHWSVHCGFVIAGRPSPHPRLLRRMETPMAEPIEHTHDAESRAAIDKAAMEIAKVLLDRDLWRASWRVEVEGCVYKFKIEGYPKYGTAKRAEQDRRNAELLAEAEAYESASQDRGAA